MFYNMANKYSLMFNSYITKSDYPDIRQYWESQSILWQKYNDAYMGGEYMRKSIYLPQMDTENSETYTNRLRYASYSNMVYRVVADYVKYIYNKEPVRTGIDSYLSLVNFYSENGRAININNFFREVFTNILKFGECYFIIDDTQIGEGKITTDADRINSNVKFLTQPVAPYRVPVYNNERAIMILDSKNYKVIYVDRIETYHEDKLESTVDNPYGIIPIQKVLIDEDNNNYGEASIRDIADMAIEIYQIESTIRVDFLKETFSPFLLPMSPELSPQYDMTFKKDSDGAYELKVLDIMPIPENADPKYLTKDLGFIDKKRDYVKEKKEDVREQMALRLSRLLVQSGTAKQYDFQDTNVSLKLLSDIAQSCEILWWNLFFNIAYDTVPEYSIEYNKVFDIKDRTEYITILNSSYDKYKEISPEWTKVMLKEIVVEQHNLPQFQKEKIYNDIDTYIDKQFITPPIVSTTEMEAVEGELLE